MNRTSFFAALVAVALVAGFVACDRSKNKDKEEDNNNSSAGSGYKIESTVVGDPSALALIASVKASVFVNDAGGHYVQIATGSCTNGTLSITLPDSLRAEYLILLASAAPPSVIISDALVKLSSDVEIAAFDASDQKTGEFFLQWDDSTNYVRGLHTYVDRDCTISGAVGSNSYNMSLTKGWNLTYDVGTDTTNLWTSTKPAGVTLQWSYSAL
ncbi:MAG: hypothetical protein LBH06_07665 [Rikenellaceae bacterium]|jgi:hypothetical protein|nr:hypothetical protein [Rikenellaceae bacterium]